MLAFLLASRIEPQESVSWRAFFSAPALVSITELEDGRFVDVNDTFVTVTGYSRESAIGATSVGLGIISPEARARYVERIRADGHVRDLELQLIRGLTVFLQTTHDLGQ